MSTGVGVVLRAGPFSMRTTRRSIAVCAILIIAVILLAAFAITLGSYTLSIGEVWSALTGGAEPRIRTVVWEWRAPRIVAAVLFGAALAVGGGILQSLTRNPLGSPDILGLTTGSYTGAICALLLGMTSYAAMGVGAIIGGLITAAVVYLLAFRRGVQGFRFVIVGVAVGAFLSSVNSWFSVKVDVDVALRAAVWGAGSLAAVDWTSVGAAAIIFAVVIAFLPLAQYRMRRLELGDDAAAMLGVPVESTKALLIVLSVIATALVTAAAGPIAFVALAAPQIARRLTGASLDLFGSALVGALLLLSADVLAQHAIPGVVLPTGAVTVCLGGAYLVWLLAYETRRTGRSI